MTENRSVWRRAFWILLAAHLAIWTLVPLLAFPNMSLDTAEAVAWGHEWQFGYFKHPPLSGWLAEIGRLASGSQATWGVYFIAQIVIVAAMYAAWRLALRLVSESLAFVAVLALEASFLYTIISLEFNVNTTALPCVVFLAWFLFEAITSGKWKWWIGFGIACGFGMLSKYTILLEIASMAIFAISNPRCRLWLRRPHPYVAAGIAIGVWSPNLVWLIVHGFPSLRYANSRTANQYGLVGHFYYPLEFVAAQIWYLAPMFAAVLPWLKYPWRKRVWIDGEQKFAARYLVYITFGPASLITLFSLLTGGNLTIVWGLPFLALFPLWLLVGFQTREIPIRHAFVFPLTLCGINIVTATFVFKVDAAIRHRPSRIMFPGKLLADKCDQLWNEKTGQKGNLIPVREKGGQTPFQVQTPFRIVAGERWLCDNVAFYSPSRPSVFCDQGNYLDNYSADPENCPWITPQSLNRDGAILIWFIKQDGLNIPAALRDAFPGAIPCGIWNIQGNTYSGEPPIQIGVGISLPK